MIVEKPTLRPEPIGSPAENGEKVRTIRVAVADDHPLTLIGIKSLIQAAEGLEVVGEASDGDSALHLVENTAPHVVLIDVPMSRFSASELGRYLVERRPKAKILVLTGLQDSAWLVELLQAGANGYLLKRSVPAELVRAIRTVLSGSVYIDPVIASTLLIRTTAGEVAATALSSREVAVLKLVARGFGNKEMAAGLMLSIKTVQTYKARAMKKLHLRTRADIVRYGAARGWIDEI
jgi:DNA-binding NarL/FixJ family response regulator